MDSDESDAEYETILRVIVYRRKRIYRERRNFFVCYDDVDFRHRFRMCKEAAWMVLELIRQKIMHKTSRYVYLNEMKTIFKSGHLFV